MKLTAVKAATLVLVTVAVSWDAVNGGAHSRAFAGGAGNPAAVLEPGANIAATAPGTLVAMPPQSAVDPRQAALGRLLFFDVRLSGDGSTSCATCHRPDRAFAGGDALSPGYRGTQYFRNAPSAMNAAHRRFLYWDGRIAGADLPTLVRDHVSEHHFMAADGRLVIERLRQIPEYADRFRQAFGSDVSYGKILNAVAAYVRTLNSRHAPLDRYLAGERSALSPAMVRGLDLFQGKAGCARCHSGPLLSDDAFHRIAVPENDGIFADPQRHITFRRFMRTLGVDDARNLRHDPGRYAVTKRADDRGRFLTPGLREVARTAPYMHNGVFATLDALVDFYDRGGGPGAEGLKPLGLTADERSDLVAFLRDGLAGRTVDATEPEIPAYGVLALPGVRVTAGGVR